MKILNIYTCSFCGGTAHEYVGLEGGLYIGKESNGKWTEHECPQNPSKDKEHNFVLKLDNGIKNLTET